MSTAGVADAISTEDSSGYEHSDLRRRPFVSRHREAIDYIATDSTESRRWAVPDQNASAEPSRTGTTLARAGLCVRRAIQKRNSENLIEFLLPSWRWLKAYDWKESIVSDVVAGLTVGVMVVPQSMSYAKLAGLPVEYGLYSALVPVYAYAFFGSSRQLAVGPVALVSLLLQTGLSLALENDNHFPEDPGYQERYNRLAIQTSFLVGVCYIVMGLLRLGFVTIFLSHAVISGFTTGAAVIIGMSQVKYILGYEIESSKSFHKLLQELFENINKFNYKTFLMGAFSILALVLMKHVGKQFPKLKGVRAMGPLSVTAVTIIITLAFGLDKKGIPVVGTIPKGLPKFTAGDWTPVDQVGNLFLVVLSIVVVGFMESIAIAKQLASKHKYEIDSSQELIGLGMANFLGGMFQAYPVTGSFSRSAVNNEGGAKSGVSGMVTATLVGFVLLLLTVVFEKLPLSVLAAIVISGVLGLLDYEEAMFLWKVHKFDFAVWLTACIGTMFLGVEIGLAIAVGVSLLIVVYESAYPHTTILGRLPGTTNYRSAKQYSNVEVYDGIVMIRIDAPLYFANAQNVRDKIRKYRLIAEERAAANDSSVRFFILDLSPVSHVDTSALHILADMNANYNSRGQIICICNPGIVVMDRLIHSGLVERIGRQNFFPSVHDALNDCLRKMDKEATLVHDSFHGLSEDGVDMEAPAKQFG